MPTLPASRGVKSRSSRVAVSKSRRLTRRSLSARRDAPDHAAYALGRGDGVCRVAGSRASVAPADPLLHVVLLGADGGGVAVAGMDDGLGGQGEEVVPD